MNTALAILDLIGADAFLAAYNAGRQEEADAIASRFRDGGTAEACAKALDLDWDPEQSQRWIDRAVELAVAGHGEVEVDHALYGRGEGLMKIWRTPRPEWYLGLYRWGPDGSLEIGRLRVVADHTEFAPGARALAYGVDIDTDTGARVSHAPVDVTGWPPERVFALGMGMEELHALKYMARRVPYAILAQDPRSEVRRWVAARPCCPDEALELLAAAERWHAAKEAE